ncbi:TPA: hypothetical protein QDE31_03525 [Burkholderia cenocepacia]|nr:hypothetical protein [Burkholderia cenocepacia]
MFAFDKVLLSCIVQGVFDFDGFCVGILLDLILNTLPHRCWFDEVRRLDLLAKGANCSSNSMESIVKQPHKPVRIGERHNPEAMILTKSYATPIFGMLGFRDNADSQSLAAL